jgi:hypothetical protein
MAGNTHVPSDKQDNEADDMDLTAIDPELLEALAGEAAAEPPSDAVATPGAITLDNAPAEVAATDEDAPTSGDATPGSEDITAQAGTAQDAAAGEVSNQGASTEEASSSRLTTAAATTTAPVAVAPQAIGRSTALPVFDPIIQAQIDVLVARLPPPPLSSASRRAWTQEEDDLLMFLSNMRVSHRVISAVSAKAIPGLRGQTSADCLASCSTTSADSAGASSPARLAPLSFGRGSGRLWPMLLATSMAPEPRTTSG